MRKTDEQRIRAEFRNKFYKVVLRNIKKGIAPKSMQEDILKQIKKEEDYLIQKLDEQEKEIVERTLDQVGFYKENSETNKKVLKEAGITEPDEHYLILNIKVWERIKEKIINSLKS